MKLCIYVAFSGNEENKAYYLKLRKIIDASNISEYFQFHEIQKIFEVETKYSCMTILRKKKKEFFKLLLIMKKNTFILYLIGK